jgi:hypothetical protein
MSKLERQRSLPRPSMFTSAPAAPVKAASKPRKAKEVPSVPVGPFDYAAALGRLGLSHKQAAELLGVSLPASYKWAVPGATVPVWLLRMLALVEHVGVDMARTVFQSQLEQEGPSP